jgi:signal transduction histidine kinase
VESPTVKAPLLFAENIHKKYADINILTDINLSLNHGEIHGLLGVDGAGKTSLVNILSGVTSPDAGCIYLDGKPVILDSSEKGNALGIGVAHQGNQLIPGMDIVENVMLSYSPRKRFLFLPIIDWKKIREAAQEALELLESDIKLDTNIRDLTFAQRQMVKIAVAIATRPKILLLDEPTYGLSTAQAQVLFKAMHRLAQHGTGILYTSQRLDELPHISDRVTVIKEGKILGTMQAGDVTLRSVVELMVEDTSQAMSLRQTDRLRRDFVSLVSHELRTPLATIRGYAETVIARKWSEEIQQECMENINAGCERLTDLVDDLLDISNLDQGSMRIEKESLMLDRLVNNLLTSQWRRKAVDHKIEARFPSEFPSIQADPRRIEQVLTNLVENSIKYSQKGGHITISGEVDEDNKAVTVTVQDEGAGISEEYIERIFERFYRAPNPSAGYTDGSGLGLSICKGIINRHGGQIWAESSPGNGTAITFSLPLNPRVVMAWVEP